MLNKKRLEKLIYDYFNKFRKEPNSAAKELANIIDDYIKNAIVKSEGTVVIPPNSIKVSGPSGISTNVQPIIIKNIKNKGSLH